MEDVHKVATGPGGSDGDGGGWTTCSNRSCINISAEEHQYPLQGKGIWIGSNDGHWNMVPTVHQCTMYFYFGNSFP